jgi:hypothetical protein
MDLYNGRDLYNIVQINLYTLFGSMMICYTTCTGPTILRGSSPAFWWERINRQTMFPPLQNQPFYYHSINVDIERPGDGNVLVAGRFLGNQQAKISWSLVTP